MGVVTMARAAKILLVEDDPNIQTLTKRLLEQAGYEVRAASNTVGAGYMLSEFEPDLVVLDIMLPGSLSGDQACPTLRKIRPGIKIVFYSGIDEKQLAKLAEKYGADAFVSKGGRSSALRRVVERLVGPARP